MSNVTLKDYNINRIENNKQFALISFDTRIFLIRRSIVEKLWKKSMKIDLLRKEILENNLSRRMITSFNLSNHWCHLCEHGRHYSILFGYKAFIPLGWLWIFYSIWLSDRLLFYLSGFECITPLGWLILLVWLFLSYST